MVALHNPGFSKSGFRFIFIENLYMGLFYDKYDREKWFNIFAFAIIVFAIFTFVMLYFFPKPQGMTDEEYIIERAQTK